MAIYAHPDDESYSVGGVLAQCASDGIPTFVVCATRGEVGEISDPALASPENLGIVREKELREASRILGVKEIDFLDYVDGQLEKADANEVVGKIVRAIRRWRPAVVVTFGLKGVYGHPDHVAIHHFASQAFHKAGDEESFPNQIREGLTAYAPQRLYYSSPGPKSALRQMREELKRRGVDFGWNVIDLDQIGDEDDVITTKVDVSAYSETKLRALLAHRTQMPGGKPFRNVPDDLMPSFLGKEYFIRVHPPVHGSAVAESNLFEGLP